MRKENHYHIRIKNCLSGVVNTVTLRHDAPHEHDFKDANELSLCMHVLDVITAGDNDQEFVAGKTIKCGPYEVWLDTKPLFGKYEGKHCVTGSARVVGVDPTREDGFGIAGILTDSPEIVWLLEDCQDRKHAEEAVRELNEPDKLS